MKENEIESCIRCQKDRFPPYFLCSDCIEEIRRVETGNKKEECLRCDKECIRPNFLCPDCIEEIESIEAEEEESLKKMRFHHECKCCFMGWVDEIAIGEEEICKYCKDNSLTECLCSLKKRWKRLNRMVEVMPTANLSHFPEMMTLLTEFLCPPQADDF